MPTAPTPHDHALPAETLDEKAARLTAEQPIVTPVRYLVSCLPEGHDDRYLFTLHVEYRGNDLWSVKCRSQNLSADGSWSWGFAWSGGNEPATSEEMASYDKEQAVWLAEHRFDLETALRLAKEQAPLLTYRGYSVTDALAERCDVGFVGGGRCSKPSGHRPPGSDDPHTP
ncbi:hypothetical protein [Streptomyces xanthophaeus]|uniref:hypothetical protein n=1 Tax=Streptomyces xanthophaeus TaxID=67385 RepID=UPI00365C0D5D